jgi:hypothetical protein
VGRSPSTCTKNKPRMHHLPASHSEEEPRRLVFTLRVSSTRTSTCTSTKNKPFRNRLWLAIGGRYEIETARTGGTITPVGGVIVVTQRAVRLIPPVQHEALAAGLGDRGELVDRH